MQVEEKLAKRTWHDELLASGILGVLKAWIEPLPDGNLPNIKASVVPAHDSDSDCNSLCHIQLMAVSIVQMRTAQTLQACLLCM